MYDCDTQEEIDKYWNALLQGGGKEIECGWLVDKFGLNWQISPRIMHKLMAEANEKQMDAMMKVVLTQKKLEIAPIVAAYEAAS